MHRFTGPRYNAGNGGHRRSGLRGIHASILSRTNCRPRGLSLIELLVVIAVATLLLSIVFVMAHGLYKVVRSFQ